MLREFIFAAAIVSLSATFVACKRQEPPQVTPPMPAKPAAEEAGPTQSDLIEAVIQAAAGETTVRTKYRQVQTSHVCSDMDVARDPYMPKNPELARCPRRGHRYNVSHSEPYQEQVACPHVPDSKGAWSVVKLGEDHWRISTGGRSWQVAKLSGSQTPPGNVVQLSSFRLSVVAEHGC